jgi:hypothetical protein
MLDNKFGRLVVFEKEFYLTYFCGLAVHKCSTVIPKADDIGI